MCGVAGVICSDRLDERDIRAVRSINDRLYHRGPDDGGEFVTDRVAMALRRLAIIDIAGGAQPIFNEDQSLAIICNGEIYNHQELRAQLSKRGHVFSSHSDIETMVHCYEERGTQFVADLRGMYAFALWDKNKQILLLGRDRLGEKPLYIWRDRRDGVSRVWFSSELRSLLTVRSSSAIELNAAAASDFLTYQYVYEPNTLIEGVSQLPPGHILQLSSECLDRAPESYWSLEAVEAKSEPEPIEAVRNWFTTACVRMGTADVPIGISLSGGIDSSLVAAVSSRHYPGQLQAFTVGYDVEVATDERAIARKLAATLQIPLTEVQLSTEEITQSFPMLVEAMDTPVGDIAAHGYFAVAKAARKAGVPVLLSGLGGDEMFWGYDWVRDILATQERRFPSSRAWWRRLLRPRFEDQLEKDRSIYARYPDIIRAAKLTQKLVVADSPMPSDDWLKKSRTTVNVPCDISVWATLNRSWLLGNCLTLYDRLSMANSVEGRLPFLDIDLISGMAGLRRAGLRDHTKSPKATLLAALGNLLPSEITQRPKQGFTPPVHLWIEAIVGRYLFLISDGGALARRGLVDPRSLAEAIKAGIDPLILFKLVMLEVWLRTVVELQPPADIVEESNQKTKQAA